MNATEVNTFIEIMEEHGDVWTPEQVEDVYGDWSFEDAVNDRMICNTYMVNILGTLINR